IREDQLAEARQEKYAALLRFLRRQRERLVEDALDLLPGEAGLLRQERDRCRLRHRLRHGGPPVCAGCWGLNADGIITTGRARPLPALAAKLSRRGRATFASE